MLHLVLKIHETPPLRIIGLHALQLFFRSMQKNKSIKNSQYLVLETPPLRMVSRTRPGISVRSLVKIGAQELVARPRCETHLVRIGATTPYLEISRFNSMPTHRLARRNRKGKNKRASRVEHGLGKTGVAVARRRGPLSVCKRRTRHDTRLY